jgi:hypothetical protein
VPPIKLRVQKLQKYNHANQFTGITGISDSNNPKRLPLNFRSVATPRGPVGPAWAVRGARLLPCGRSHQHTLDTLPPRAAATLAPASHCGAAGCESEAKVRITRKSGAVGYRGRLRN